MSFAFKRMLHKGAAAGGGGRLTPQYDNRFGTDTVGAAVSGWFTFGLRPGCRRIWVNSSGGSDANDGLSAATAKATFDAAFGLFIGGGFTAGDQMMIAGTGGRTYTDNLTGRWTMNGGFSLAYPTAVLSYDPADAANAIKYGKLTGPDMPSIVVTTLASSFQISGSDNASHYFAIQGIEFDAQGGGIGASLGGNFLHNGQCYQNCRFKEITLGIDDAGSPNGLILYVNISKCAFWGQWDGVTSPGNCQGTYVGGINGLWCQDNVFAHCGWKVGVSRGENYLYGGPTFFCHAHYYHAAGINGRFDRNVYVDTALDGFNCRGGAAASQLVTLDDAVPGTIGAFSNGSDWATEAPNGVLITVDDWVIMGGAPVKLVPGYEGGGNGPSNTNTVNGSYLRNVAAFDNPLPSQSYTFGPHNDQTGMIEQYITIDKFHAYNYAVALEGGGGVFPTHIHDTWTNGLVDSLTPALSTTTLTNTFQHSGAASYPNAKTRDQVVTTMLTGMGLTPGATYTARKAQLVNAMLWRPDLRWAEALITIGLPTLGLTPTYTDVSPPSYTGITPRTVYSSDGTAPVLSSPTGTATGTTTATVGMTTNEGNGVWAWVVSTSSTPPAEWDIHTGVLADHATVAPAHGRATVTSTGAKTASATGLTTATTYYMHATQYDAAGNQGNIVTSAAFTTS